MFHLGGHWLRVFYGDESVRLMGLLAALGCPSCWVGGKSLRSSTPAHLAHQRQWGVLGLLHGQTSLLPSGDAPHNKGPPGRSASRPSITVMRCLAMRSVRSWALMCCWLPAWVVAGWGGWILRAGGPHRSARHPSSSPAWNGTRLRSPSPSRCGTSWSRRSKVMVPPFRGRP